jgi:hypothetical protein
LDARRCTRAAYGNDRDFSISRWQLGKMLHQLRDQAEGATPMFCAEHESAGTTRTSRSLLRMSVHWGEVVMPTSLPEMTRMTDSDIQRPAQ